MLIKLAFDWNFNQMSIAHSSRGMIGKNESVELSPACNRDLKLGDNCDACWRGIMLPPGGLAYYEKILENPNPPAPHGHEKIVCPRCGHFHRFVDGSTVISGKDEVNFSASQ